MAAQNMHEQQDRHMTGRGPRWRWLIACLAAIAWAAWAHAAAPSAAPISGAGATFPGPLYQAWARAYQATAGIEVSLDPVGSGLGIQRIEQGAVDFGASDAALTPAQLAAAGLVQFPVVIGGVLPVINISGVRPGEMKLTATVLADIYLGRVRRWNDPAIVALNPALHLPGSNSTVVHRAESSGSSLLWTEYLSAGNEAWRARIGASTTPKWPAGVGARGNEGVASLVQRTRFAIGYVEYYFARAHGLSDVALRNRDGHFVRARPDNFAAAAAATMASDPALTQQLPTDAGGEFSWPITGASFILVPRVVRDAERARTMLRFFDWALHRGGDTVEQLDYAPVPPPLVERLPMLWQTIRDASDQRVWP